MEALTQALRNRIHNPPDLPCFIGEAGPEAEVPYAVLTADAGQASPGRYGDTRHSDLAAKPQIMAVSNDPLAVLRILNHVRERLTGWEPPGGWCPLHETETTPVLAEREAQHTRWSSTLTYATSKRRIQ